ncbi:MAG: leucine-rich repeat protein [Oscillospiraceae bacterium]|nr:leucine-rich repeat protein [Oscillospiraceae bacterium]
MKIRKNHLLKATALCAAALLTGTSMLGAASPDAIPVQLAADDAAEASWTLDADGTLTISGDIPDRTCPWKDQAEQIKKVIFTKQVYISFRENLFEGCVNLTTAVLSDDYSVRGDLFKGCTALTDVTIPEGVSNISSGAFEGCTALKEIKLPESLSSISDEAFRGCTSLDNIVIPENFYTFGAYAFADCTSLTHIEFNNKMNVVARHVFENTPWLKAEQEKDPLVIVGNYLIDASACTGDVVLPDGLEGMGGAFADTPITSVTIPESVYNINADSFRNCTGLTEVKLPSELNTLASNAFAGCTGLTHIEIPDTVTVFSSGVFSGCTNLKSVKLPQGEYPHAITKIEDHTFEGCSSLESIELPEALYAIGNSAFAGCGSLTEITVPSKVRSIDSYAFKDCDLEKLTILDPLCTFTDSTFTGTIRKIVGYKGSTAEIAAEKCEIEFEDLGMFVGGTIEDYGKLSSKYAMKILKPGDTFEFGEGTGKWAANFFVTGTDAKIAEAAFEVEDLDNLSFTMNELDYTIQESSLYEATSYQYFFYDNSRPVGVVRITGKFTIKDTIKSANEELRLVCTKLVDESGTDLLADMPDHKATLTYQVRMYSPSTPKPTEPTTEPTEATTEPTEAPTDATEATEPVTEPTDATEATDPVELPDPVHALLGDVNEDGIVNASDAALILIAAASIGAGEDSGLTESQMAAANVNGDSAINASDAAVVLIYAAAVGAGNTDANILDYVH